MAQLRDQMELVGGLKRFCFSSQNRLKADRPHPRNYPHTPTNDRHTYQHLRLAVREETDGRTDGCYQVHYLPRFAVDNNFILNVYEGPKYTYKIPAIQMHQSPVLSNVQDTLTQKGRSYRFSVSRNYRSSLSLFYLKHLLETKSPNNSIYIDLTPKVNILRLPWPHVLLAMLCVFPVLCYLLHSQREKMSQSHSFHVIAKINSWLEQIYFDFTSQADVKNNAKA